MNIATRFRVCVVSLAVCALASVAQAQSAGDSAPAVSRFAFATIAEGRAILGARDDYVRATTALERSAKLRVADVVDEDRFVRHMESAVLDWNDEERRAMRPLIERLERFLAGSKWKIPARILIIQADKSLEDDAPHTRANAVVLPKDVLYGPPPHLTYVMSHELFHVLTRADSELREKLYGAIGFKRCEHVDLPQSIAELRITNPDAVENRHVIAVRYRGEAVEALPFLRFRSGNIDPRAGFIANSEIAWLLVDREGAVCRARGAPAGEAGVSPEQLQGLHEQVGRNTGYLIHAEEILADNFSALFTSTTRRTAPAVPSPEILEKMRRILFE
jgi:hypothetical protein